MRKEKTFCLVLILVALVLFVSCTTENNIIANSTDIPNKESENSINGLNLDFDDEISTQIGDLIIITPKGQEPIQNEDGTITLPGGGMYELDRGKGIEKVIMSSGAIIRSDGTFSFNTDIGLNIDTVAIIEQANGDAVVMSKGESITINDRDFKDIWADIENIYSSRESYYADDSDDWIQSEISKKWNNNRLGYPWEQSVVESNRIFEFKDGTKITMPADYVMTSDLNNIYSISFSNQKCMIEYFNGITVNAPIDTLVEFEDEAYTITIGDGDATITQPDGTSSTVPKSTVLDSEGNIIN